MVEVNEITNEKIKADILHKLYRKKKWGGAHTAFQNLYKWCDKKYTERYKNVAKDMIKEGFITSKPTHYGLEISLNPNKREDIIKIIKEFFETAVY